KEYTHLQINLGFTRDSTESLVYDILQLNVLHTGRLVFQLARYSSFQQPWHLSVRLRESSTKFLSARRPKWLEREITDRKVRGSNPSSASRLPLSRLGQPGSIPALVQPSGGMAVRHRKGATAERLNKKISPWGFKYNWTNLMIDWSTHASIKVSYREPQPATAGTLPRLYDRLEWWKIENYRLPEANRHRSHLKPLISTHKVRVRQCCLIDVRQHFPKQHFIL
ncbi:hypothetical protein T265_12827, partial [Opisthorchis viverrini]